MSSTDNTRIWTNVNKKVHILLSKGNHLVHGLKDGPEGLHMKPLLPDSLTEKAQIQNSPHLYSEVLGIKSPC